MGNHFANSGSESTSLLHNSWNGDSGTFSSSMDFGALYAQGYRKVLTSYVDINTGTGGSRGWDSRIYLKLTDTNGTVLSSDGRAVTAYGEWLFPMKVTLPKSGTGYCSVTLEEYGGDDLSRCRIGDTYLLT